MRNLNSKNPLKFLVALVGILCFLSSCEKDMEGKIYQVSGQFMIDEILGENPDLSDFLYIVDLANMRGTIHAYGTYTLFAPTNNAVNEYLTGIGISLSGLTSDKALEIVKYHLIPDTIPTADFIDGRIQSGNFMNTYLTTKTVQTTENETGILYEVNRQGYIIDRDIRAGNGYVHVVDGLLHHPKTTITQVIESLSDEYSIMKEVYELSGFDKYFMDEDNTGNSYTFFIQNDEAFSGAGIESIDDLLDELRRQRPDVQTNEELIYDYIAYHCLPTLNYVSDLGGKTSVETVAANQVISLSRNVDQIILDYYEINGEIEEGALIDRTSDYTDLTCANGVIHKINSNIQIIIRPPYRVYWDLAEQPEIQAMRSFRQAGAIESFTGTELEQFSWIGGANLTYRCLNPSPVVIVEKEQYIYGDYLSVRISTAHTNRVEIKMPLLMEGQYKVWVCYRPEGHKTVMDNGQPIRTVFKQDGQEEQDLGILKWFWYMNNPSAYGSSYTSSDEAFHIKLENDGMKQYYASSIWTNVNNALLLGIIDVQNTGAHTLIWEPQNNGDFRPNLDMLQFIPLNEEQRWPRVDIAGKWIYENTPECEIYPYTDCNTGD